MHGPIDYIIVSFKDNKFDGSILSSLQDAISKDIIDVLALTVISKDSEGTVTEIDAVNLGDSSIVSFSQSIKQDPSIVTQDDIEEVGDLLENNSTAGLLVIEQLWAKPLKQALINANGTLIAEGRIHPEASKELDNQEGEE